MEKTQTMSTLDANEWVDLIVHTLQNVTMHTRKKLFKYLYAVL